MCKEQDQKDLGEVDMKKSAYIENGIIYIAEAEKPVERLVLLIDGESDVLLTYGDVCYVQSKLDMFNAMAQEFTLANLCNPYSALCMVNAFNLPIEKQCYMLRRCIEYTASGFCKNIYEHMNAGDLEAWLDVEMARVPLDVYGK